MSFKVGDVVEFVNNAEYPDAWTNARAVVGAIKMGGLIVCVHFDNPEIERSQAYGAGWSGRCFRLVSYDPSESIPEDWS